MNKKKTVTLKDPRLRAIRNSLREVLSLVVIAEETRLFKTMHKEDKKTADGYERFCKMHAKMNALSISRKESIIECPACFAIDRDVQYNPYDNAWYCVDCYKLIGDMYYVTMAKKEMGQFVGRDYDEKFARSFTEDDANIEYEIQKLKKDMKFQVISLEALSLEVELLHGKTDSEIIDFIIKSFFVAWIVEDEKGFGEASYYLAPFFKNLKRAGLYKKYLSDPLLKSIEKAGKKCGLLNG